jgi:lysyl-tRNA synthetase class 2
MSETTNWQINGPLRLLQQRAFLCAEIRAFFAARQVTEVVTPTLSSAANTDLQIEVFSTEAIADDRPRAYLRTSPEFFHKRLLCSGSGDIFELAQVFRKGEVSASHNPEFTMLEWYRLNWSWQQLAEEVTALVDGLREAFGLPPMAVKTISYQQLFVSLLSLDPFDCTLQALNQMAIAAGYHGSPMDRVTALDFLFAICVEPRLEPQQGYLIHDFPIEQAALAQAHPERPDRCLRFELLWGGLELANGYQELTDAAEQRRRFVADNEARTAAGKPALPVDEHLLAALTAGMPACSGVALGMDRLLMCLLGCTELQQVLPFPASRC